MGDVRGETRLFSPLGKSSDDVLRFIDFVEYGFGKYTWNLFEDCIDCVTRCV